MSTQAPDTPFVDPVAEPQQESPGALLREARERARLTLDELSLQTRLARNALQALERDDFAALLEPVYVRGYYRKCAKVLDVSEQRLIAAYERAVAPRTPQLPAKLRLASGTDLDSGGRLPVPLSLAAAILAVIVCGVLWMTLQGGHDQPTTQPAAVVITTATPPSAVAAVGPALRDDTQQSAAVPDSSPTAPPAAGTPSSPGSHAVAAAQPPLPAQPGTAAPADAAVLHFENTSWVRIDDANGKLLLSGEFSAGQARSVRGATPFNVHLGNARAVRLEYRGQPVDFSAQLRNNGTARFTLPLASN